MLKDDLENDELGKIMAGNHRAKSIFVPIVAGGIVIILLIGASWLAYGQFKPKTDESLQSVAKTADQKKLELDSLLERVGHHIVLPTTETPSVAEITDIESLAKQQSFYVGAKNGNKILLYPEAKKLIIYDDVNDILINVGSLLDDPGRATSSNANNQMSENIIATASSSPAVIEIPATLEIRNGTTKTGWAKTNSNLFVNSPLFKVTKIATATKTDYPVTIIVNQKGLDVSTLENRYSVVATGKMTAGEAPSTADVVLILGLK